MDYSTFVLNRELEVAEQKVARLSDEIAQLSREQTRKIDERDQLLAGISNIRDRLGVEH